MHEQPEVLLSVRGLAKSYDGIRILDDVDLTVRKGEVLGFLGANGAGKSTLMGLLTGRLRPDAGHMELKGEPYSPTTLAEARAAGVGLISQRLELDPDLTVAQTLVRFTEHADRPEDELLEWVRGAIRRTGLRMPIRPEARIAELDRSERALVEATRMLVENTALVVMDEVAATFNISEIIYLHLIVRLLASRGQSIIYVSHRLHEVVAVSQRVAVLRQGAVTVELNPRRVVLRDLSDEMLEYEPGAMLDRSGHVTDQLALEVVGLQGEHLDDVSFTLNRGEVLGVIGPRGSGNQHLADAVAGVIPSTAQSLKLHGKERVITDAESAEDLRIMYLGDHEEAMGIDEKGTVATNIVVEREGLDTGLVNEIAARRSAVEQFQRLRIRTSGINRQAGVLSGGDLAKVAMLRWVNSDADIVVLCQPTRGLDVGSRTEVFNLLAAHTSAGRSAIIVSNEPEEVLTWCDRVAIMSHGKLVEVVPASQLDEDTVIRAMSEQDGSFDDEMRVVRSGRAPLN